MKSDAITMKKVWQLKMAIEIEIERKGGTKNQFVYFPSIFFHFYFVNINLAKLLNAYKKSIFHHFSSFFTLIL